VCVHILHEIRLQRKAELRLLDSRNKALVTIWPHQIEEKNPKQTQFRNDSPKSTPFSKPPGPPKEDHCQGTRRRSTSAAAARRKNVPRPVRGRAAAEGLRRLRTPPGVPNPALGNHLPSFSGPRYLNRNKSVLFASICKHAENAAKPRKNANFLKNRGIDTLMCRIFKKRWINRVLQHVLHARKQSACRLKFLGPENVGKECPRARTSGGARQRRHSAAAPLWRS